MHAEFTTSQSRFQLMLYKFLFDIHSCKQFDWARFYTHIGLQPEDTFSTAFIDQTSMVFQGLAIDRPFTVATLGDLAEILQKLHQELGTLQDDLELVYRWRGPVNRSSSKHSSIKRGSHGISEDLVFNNASNAATEGSNPAPLDPAASPQPEPEHEPSTAPANFPSMQDMSDKAEDIKAEEEGSVIGTEKFSYNGEKLREYLLDALSFWKGRVSLDN